MSPDPAIDAAIRHLRAAARAEAVVLNARVTATARRGGLIAFAGLIAVFGLAALDGAAYFWLAPIWGAALAMVAVAVADFIVAALLVALAAIERRRPELALAEEMRDSALQALELDVKLAGASVLRVARNPLELLTGPLVSLATSVLAGLVRGRRKRKPK